MNRERLPGVMIGLVLVLLAASSRAGEVLQPGNEEAPASQYDFIPGDKVLFYEDFAHGLKRLKSASPRLDIQAKDGGKWLHCRPPCSFDVILPEKLPARFTVDFDFEGDDGVNPIWFTPVSADGSDIDGAKTAASAPNTISLGESNNELPSIVGPQRRVHFSWVFDGDKAKAYAFGRAALNAPEASMPRTARLRFVMVGGDDPTLIDYNVPVWITNLRIAGGGGPVSFDELMKKGRVTLRGILFDTGSDRIRPDSAGTLAQVARMMTDHKDLRLLVEGHTDTQGVPAANLALSVKRAAAVKAWLVTKHKADASRLETAGFGGAKPAAGNDTDEGRQANRRVELSRRE